MKEIVCKGERILLLPQRALYWPGMRTLVLADMHLGKTAHFRAHGIPIPSSVMKDDLQCLSAIIEQFDPKRILIVGDMFHDKLNGDIDIFGQWRLQYAADFVLVPGNHDKLLQIDYERLGIIVTEARHVIKPFVFVHEYLDAPETDHFFISGHLHPGYLLQGKARQAMRLACFIVSSNSMILPAFSAFTGLYTGYEINPSHRYYIIGNNEVLEVAGR
ncbi:MAG: ligase-associated DNA damage response endonuclease PdeM [Niabella sp.]